LAAFRFAALLLAAFLLAAFLLAAFLLDAFFLLVAVSVSVFVTPDEEESLLRALVSAEGDTDEDSVELEDVELEVGLLVVEELDELDELEDVELERSVATVELETTVDEVELELETAVDEVELETSVDEDSDELCTAEDDVELDDPEPYANPKMVKINQLHKMKTLIFGLFLQYEYLNLFWTMILCSRCIAFL